jgi:RNA polymerase sigma factor (sigma-70 family)
MLRDNPRQIFPTTQHSIIEAVGDPDPARRRQALDTLITAYWRPAYLHLRLKWGHDRDAAEDLTQEFFARTLDGGFFDRFDPARARFRTFLRTALDHLAANQRRDQAREKRGGSVVHLSLDFEAAEQEIGAEPSRSADPDERFHREWVRSLFTMAVEALRAECTAAGHERRFAVFQRCDLDPADPAERPSYKELAEEFTLPVTQVTNHLAWARREFRRLVLERLRQLSGSEAEFRSEARDLFGIDPA